MQNVLNGPHVEVLLKLPKPLNHFDGSSPAQQEEQWSQVHHEGVQALNCRRGVKITIHIVKSINSTTRQYTEYAIKYCINNLMEGIF